MLCARVYAYPSLMCLFAFVDSRGVRRKLSVFWSFVHNFWVNVILLCRSMRRLGRQRLFVVRQ